MESVPHHCSLNAMTFLCILLKDSMLVEIDLSDSLLSIAS